MTPAIQHWVKTAVERGIVKQYGTTLEVGSRDVNGSVRAFFGPCYIGVDMEEGPGVDLVSDAHYLTLDLEMGSFDTVLCLEMLEHDTKPWITRENLYKCLKPGGVLVISVPTNGFPEHRYPLDLFRYLPDSFPHFFFENMDILAFDRISSVKDQWTLIGAARKV